MPSTVSLSRNGFFAGLCIAAFVNGSVDRIFGGLRDRDLIDFLSNTLDISVIVWISLSIGVWMLLRSTPTEITYTDKVVALAASLGILVPGAPLSWLALSGVAWHIVRTSPSRSMGQRAGWILLAVTFPMFWSRIIFSLFSGAILNFDAAIVGWIMGTERIGNAIEFADGSGYLWIAPSCSSFANVSLAVLCFALFVETHDGRRASHYIQWAVLACVAVIAINVTRLALIGLYSEYFDVIHGPIGATVANWLMVGAIFGIFAAGMRHDRLAIR